MSCLIAVHRAAVGLALSAAALGAQSRVLTADDYARAERALGFATLPLVSGMGVQPNWLADGRFWYRVRRPDGSSPVILVDPVKGSKTNCVSNAAVCAAFVNAPPPIIVPRRVGAAPESRSPDGTKGVFIRDWNLWVRDIATNAETQLTADGVPDFGYATDNAGWIHSDRAIVSWSPDSRKIATFQQDQRGVGEMFMVRTEVGHPVLSRWKYPLPGDSVVSMIQRVVIDLSGGTPNVVRFRMPPDQHRSTVCDHISCVDGEYADVQWYPDGSKLAFVSSSRDHKVATLRVADATTGDVRDVLREEVKTQFESGDNVPNWRVLPASNEVLWFSERDDWGQLYLYDLASGALKRQVTTGAGNLVSIVRLDEKARKLWFVGVGKESGRDPYFRHLYSIGLDGKPLTLLTPEDGDHNVVLSPDGRYVLDGWSRPDLPPTSVLRHATTGKLIATLETADISKLTATGWKPPTRITVKSRDGTTDLYGLMFTPSNLDSTRQYPIINYIYPGPQVGSVGSRSFSASRGDHQALANLGFVVVQIDGTGTPLRSKSFHDAYYGRMGDNTLPDQVAGMKELAQRYRFIDIGKAGIWGHSGGGFATAGAMFRYPDFFKVGIAESGNHDNRNYEDDWGERYHGLLAKGADGKDNYDAEANQTLAKNLKGKLLLAHGTLDDNVPPDNTLLVADALIKAGKDFDLLMIPNAAHGYGAASNYMMRRRWDYFVTHLMGATPPKEYQIGPKDPRP
ncbi:MAG: DPP IV N-terminal domain-containing protein [Gemmatimonadaceae bacterium]|nr:DPP IV N-terminal domain-containing protein [Gemmatimonadaceae bacterium]